MGANLDEFVGRGRIVEQAESLDGARLFFKRSGALQRSAQGREGSGPQVRFACRQGTRDQQEVGPSSDVRCGRGDERGQSAGKGRTLEPRGDRAKGLAEGWTASANGVEQLGTRLGLFHGREHASRPRAVFIASLVVGKDGCNGVDGRVCLLGQQLENRLLLVRAGSVEGRDQRRGRIRGRLRSRGHQRGQRIDEAFASSARTNRGNSSGDLGQRGRPQPHQQGLAGHARGALRQVGNQAIRSLRSVDFCQHVEIRDR